MKSKRQLQRERIKDNKMDSFLRKVSKTNTFNKKNRTIEQHVKDLRNETSYSKEEQEELEKQKVKSFEDL